MNAQFKPHPDGIKAYMGNDRLTGLYSVRIGWTVYAANANGSVLYTVKGEVKTPLNVEVKTPLNVEVKTPLNVEVKTPLNVEEFKAKRPKVYATLISEISFQRKKALAIALQLNNIPSYDRKAYKNKRGFTGSR